jgi:hypothetical protein
MRTRRSYTQITTTTRMPATVELTELSVAGNSATDPQQQQETQTEAEALVLDPSPSCLHDRRRLSQTTGWRHALVFLLAVVTLVGAVILRHERLGDSTVPNETGELAATPETFQASPGDPMASPTNFASPTAATDPRLLRIQIASDLHIEFNGTLDQVPNDIILPRAPVLALLGDVGLAFTPLLQDFLHLQADRFETVLFLAGNHEFYNKGGTPKSVAAQRQWISEVCDARDNLHFLEESSLLENGVRILATTLWSYIPPTVESQAERSMNDYHLSYVRDDSGDGLRQMTAADTSQWHAHNVEWLAGEISVASQRKEPVLVLTHHTPSLTGTSAPRFDGNALSHCFSSDLSRLLQAPAVRAWACGHTHWNFDLPLGDNDKNVTRRLFSNQHGYKGHESMLYDNEGRVLEISSDFSVG